ncbi:MAG: two-component regulator propeller domain-containing protein [Acidobacteriota bacterium]
MKFRRWRSLVVPLILILCGVSGIALIHDSVRPDPGPLPGWQVIRPPREVSALTVQDEIVWVGGQEGVFAIDRTSGKLLRKLQGDTPFEYVKALLVDNDNVLWIGHKNGLTRYDGKRFVTYTKGAEIPDNRVNCLLQDKKGQLWVGTWGGAAVYNGQDWRFIKKSDGLADDMVNVIMEDRRGGMWFGSYVAPHGGLSYYDDHQWRVFDKNNGLPHNNICYLLEDAKGMIWAGTGFLDQGGAVCFDNKTEKPCITSVLQRKDGLAGAKVRSIFQDRSGVYWFGSEYDGIARWDGHSWRIFTKNDGMSGNEVKDWLEDDMGGLWMATESGVTRINSTAVKNMIK